MSKTALPNTMLLAMILSTEALITRHIEVLDRKPNIKQDYEVFDARETISDAKNTLALYRDRNSI